MTGQPGRELLRLEGIGVRLGGREILRNVSFTVAPGQFAGTHRPQRREQDHAAEGHPQPADPHVGPGPD
jgi:hypothetical protein